MPTGVVFLVYGTSFVLVLLFLFLFHARAWYWHVLSIGLAIGLGLVRLPENLQGPQTDLAVGAGFVLLMFWGIGGILLKAGQHTGHQKHA